MEERPGHLYDYPKYYDLIFGSDWKDEHDFLRDCFEKHASRKVTRLFEPACGTGRLMFRFAKSGYDIAGIDLNPNAVDYCNARLRRHGFPATARVADMSDFRVKQKFDAAFNTINSFRHLPTERQAEDHLRCIANALKTGGLYVLGLHLTPTKGPRQESEEWVGRRGNLAVVSRLWSEDLDLKKRNERVGMTFDVWTPTQQFRLVDEMNYRTYTAAQMKRLLAKVPQFQIEETYDFQYQIFRPIEITEWTEDVLFVLRKQ